MRSAQSTKQVDVTVAQVLYAVLEASSELVLEASSELVLEASSELVIPGQNQITNVVNSAFCSPNPRWLFDQVYWRPQTLLVMLPYHITMYTNNKGNDRLVALLNDHLKLLQERNSRKQAELDYAIILNACKVLQLDPQRPISVTNLEDLFSRLNAHLRSDSNYPAAAATSANNNVNYPAAAATSADKVKRRDTPPQNNTTFWSRRPTKTGLSSDWASTISSAHTSPGGNSSVARQPSLPASTLGPSQFSNVTSQLSVINIPREPVLTAPVANGTSLSSIALAGESKVESAAPIEPEPNRDAGANKLLENGRLIDEDAIISQSESTFKHSRNKLEEFEWRATNAFESRELDIVGVASEIRKLLSLLIAAKEDHDVGLCELKSVSDGIALEEEKAEFRGMLVKQIKWTTRNMALAMPSGFKGFSPVLEIVQELSDCRIYHAIYYLSCQLFALESLWNPKDLKPLEDHVKKSLERFDVFRKVTAHQMLPEVGMKPVENEDLPESKLFKTVYEFMERNKEVGYEDEHIDQQVLLDLFEKIDGKLTCCLGSDVTGQGTAAD